MKQFYFLHLMAHYASGVQSAHLIGFRACISWESEITTDATLVTLESIIGR